MKQLGGHYAELPVDKLLGNDYNRWILEVSAGRPLTL